MDRLPSGKLPAALLRALLGDDPPPPELRVPPQVGEDGCVIEVGGGALVVATDPITLTGSGVGAHAVVINANDVAVMGARPRWFLAAVLLPLGTGESDVRELFAEMRAELVSIGATLVGGHTEVTSAVTQPVVVGQMLGFREDGGFVRTGGVRPGDLIVQVGPAPVEGAYVLGLECAEKLRGLPDELLARARGALDDPGISVVGSALRCAELGASALHDPTEGGLSAGLHELAEASSVAIRDVDPEGVAWFEPGVAICRALDADPWGTLASGALLAAFSESDAERALGVLGKGSAPCAIIGRAASGSGVWLRGGEALARFERDELSRLLG